MTNETKHMKRFTGKRAAVAAVAAALALALAVGAYAAVTLLTPAQIARELDDPALAEAFGAADMATQKAEVGGYEIAFEGIVSGDGLSKYEHMSDGEVLTGRSYAVFAVSGPGGEALDLAYPGAALSDLDLSITPLVYGHLPWEVNIYTLNGGYTGIVRDGVAYFLFRMDTLEQFAGETVVFAAYAGFGPPSAERFSMAEDGTITLGEGTNGAIFTLG